MHLYHQNKHSDLFRDFLLKFFFFSFCFSLLCGQSIDTHAEYENCEYINKTLCCGDWNRKKKRYKLLKEAKVIHNVITLCFCSFILWKRKKKSRLFWNLKQKVWCYVWDSQTPGEEKNIREINFVKEFPSLYMAKM